MATLDFTCKKCKRSEKKSVSHIDPKLFKDPAKAVIKLGFWCKDCSTNTGIEYKCLADGTVQLLGEFNPTPQLGKFREASVDEEEDWVEAEETVTTLQPEDIVVEVTD